MKRHLKSLQFVTSLLPLAGCVFFLIYVFIYEATGEVHWMGMLPALFLFISFYSIWIWLFLTILISFVERRIYIKKKRTLIFITGASILLLILKFNPGGYLGILLD